MVQLLEFLKILVPMVVVIGGIGTIPYRIIAGYYKESMSLNKKQTSDIITLQLNEVRLQGAVKTLEVSRVTQDQLDQKIDKIETNITHQFQQQEDRFEKNIAILREDIKDILKHIQHVQK